MQSIEKRRCISASNTKNKGDIIVKTTGSNNFQSFFIMAAEYVPSFLHTLQLISPLCTCIFIMVILL